MMPGGRILTTQLLNKRWIDSNTGQAKPNFKLPELLDRLERSGWKSCNDTEFVRTDGRIISARLFTTEEFDGKTPEQSLNALLRATSLPSFHRVQNNQPIPPQTGSLS